MNKNISNKLKLMIACGALFTVLVAIIALAVPFENKFNNVYWLAFISSILAFVAVASFAAIVMGNAPYANEKCANRIFLVSICFLLLQNVLAVVFMAINKGNIQNWIPIVILAGVFVIMTFALAAILITGKEEVKTE